jgi:uncharacterized protein (TIRG00374 family)
MLISIRCWFLRLLPWLISVVCFYGFFSVAPAEDVLERLVEVDIRWLTLAVIAVGINLLARGIRTGVILNRSDPPSLLLITAISNVGLALNALLPGRVGEVARVFLNIKLMGVRTGQAVMTSVIERLIDLVMLLALGWYALVRVDLSATDYGVHLIAVLESLVVLSALLLVAIASAGFERPGRTFRLGFYKFFNSFPRLRRVGIRLIRDAHYISRNHMCTRAGAWSLSVSLAMLLTLVLTVFLVGKAMPRMELDLMSCLAITALTTLASALPAAPGSWGTYEAVGILVAKQIAPQYSWADIGAFIFACHLAQYLPILLAGLLSWLPLKSRASFSSLVNRNP